MAKSKKAAPQLKVPAEPIAEFEVTEDRTLRMADYCGRIAGSVRDRMTTSRFRKRLSKAAAQRVDHLERRPTLGLGKQPADDVVMNSASSWGAALGRCCWTSAAPPVSG